jgi:glutamyl-tRNA reductase
MLIGTSFKTSSIKFRETVAHFLLQNDPAHFLRSLPNVQEFAILVTCNRIETFIATDEPARTAASFFSQMERVVGDAKVAFHVERNFDAVTHLFKVASGLDSLVVGEEQILEQLKKAGTESKISGSSKSILSSLFDAAINVGKRIRSSHRLPSSNSSVSAFALRFAVNRLGKKPRKVLLVGTGKTAKLAVTGLKSKVYVVSKRKDIPKSFAKATVVSRRELKRVAKECDLIISATKSAGYVIKKGDLRDDRSVILLDLAFPRNIDPNFRKSRLIQLYDLDDLAEHAKKTFSRNLPFRNEGERMIREEAERFMRWVTASRLSPTLATVYKWAEEIRSSETEVALRRLSTLSEREKRIIDAMGKRLVSKLLAPPTIFAKRSGDDITQAERLRLLEKIFVRSQNNDDN